MMHVEDWQGDPTRGTLRPVTWPFVYLMSLVTGLTLIVVTRVFRGSPPNGGDPGVVVPSADQVSIQLRRAAVRIAYGLTCFGFVGLPLSVWQGFSPATTVVLSGALAIVGAVFPPIRFRRTPVAPKPETGAVIRAISPGGFGQVEMVHHGARVVLAARSADEEGIPVGCEVEIVDASRSVLTVRRRETHP